MLVTKKKSASQEAIDERRAPLLLELSSAARAENWTSAAAIKNRLERLSETVVDQRLRERAASLAVSDAPVMSNPVESISEVLKVLLIIKS